MKKLILFFLIICFTKSYSQETHEAPTLQVGLSGINFSRGNLDAELIAEIIAEKQKEIKVRLIKNMFLEKLGVKNGLFYTFIDNNIDIILKEKDEDTRIKNLLENAVNLSFVVGYTEYYVRTLEKDSVNWNTMKSLATAYGVNENVFDKDKISLRDFTKIDFIKSNEKEGKNEIDKSTDFKEEKNNFVGILIDLFAEQVRRNEKFKSLGILRTNYLQNSSSSNMYLDLLEERDDNASEFNILFEQVGMNLEMHTKYYGIIKTLVELNGKDLENSLSLLTNNFNCGDLNTMRADLQKTYTNAYNSIRDFDKLTDDEIKSLKDLNSFIGKLKYVDLNRSEYIRLYQNEILPAIEKLGIHSIKFLEMSDKVSDILFCISDEIKGDLESINIDVDLSFLSSLTRIDEFDKVDTYSFFLNQLSDAGDVFSDEQMRNSINLIINFIRSYIKIDEDVNQETIINLDVEGFLYNLQSIPYNKFRPLEFLFTVGANTSSFNSTLTLDNGDTLENFSFISEKIGVKYKLFDYQYVQSFSRGETFTYHGKSYKRLKAPSEPIISNIHLLAYGSGILYNIVNTGTNNQFNSPIIAGGIGVSFYNNLDFNISYGKVISSKSNNGPSFFNFGFDIQFLEYFDRLQEKRRDNKNRKTIEKNIGKASR